MTHHFSCPPLGIVAELTDERAEHIAQHHPDLMPAHLQMLATTLADPDTIRTSRNMPSARLVARLFEELGGGKHVVVVVVLPGAGPQRSWIATAYMTRRLAPGDITWTRPT
jgi:hypothetical protein